MICVLSCSIEAITRLQPIPIPGTTRPTYAQAMPSDAKPPRRCENGIVDVLQAQAYMLFYEQR